MHQMTAPHVSVIVPCYNGERYLKATLDSVFSQTFADFELIVVDDGSTDGSAEIIRAYGDRIRSVFTENKGVSAARNLGTRLACGARLQYLDADDLLHPDALKLRVAALTGITLGVAISEWRELVELSPGQYHHRAHGRPSFQHLGDAEDAIFGGFWAPPAAIMYTRDIVARIGAWNERLPIIQDARFLLDAAFYGANFVLIPDVVADYRIALQASLSRSSRARFIADQAKNLADIENRWHANGGVSTQRLKLLNDAHGSVVRAWFELDRVEFRAALAHARRLNPHFIPNGSNAYRWLCRAVGVGFAERIAFVGRACKRMVQGNAHA